MPPTKLETAPAPRRHTRTAPDSPTRACYLSNPRAASRDDAASCHPWRFWRITLSPVLWETPVPECHYGRKSGAGTVQPIHCGRAFREGMPRAVASVGTVEQVNWTTREIFHALLAA